jgi:hypothetical protein
MHVVFLIVKVYSEKRTHTHTHTHTHVWSIFVDGAKYHFTYYDRLSICVSVDTLRGWEIVR